MVSMAVAFCSFASLLTYEYILNRKKCQTFFRKKVKIGFAISLYSEPTITWTLRELGLHEV